MNAAPLFELDEMSFAVAGRNLLEPLTLVLPQRRMIGLIGHNGSGKSTLVKILARQQAASQGAVRFQGKALAAWGKREFARKLAYLPQHTPQASGLLVKELVALGRYPWRGAIGRFDGHDREKVAEAIALTDLASLADRLVDTLSGGERQRAWLAMLLAQDTECLVLDEPISALDLAHQVELLSLVRKLAHAKGLGVLVVLHDINMAARFCDEILALHSGKVIARGEPEAVMTPEALYKIYGIALDVIRHPGIGRPMASPARTPSAQVRPPRRPIFCLRIGLSENRFALFGPMLQAPKPGCARPRNPGKCLSRRSCHDRPCPSDRQ